MSSISLSFYAIQVKKKHTTKVLNLSNFIQGQNDTDLFVILDGIISQLDEYSDQVHTIADASKNNDKRHLYGKIKFGTSGFGSTIRDKKGKQKYNRIPTDIEDIPLYYNYYIPKDNLTGVIAYENFNRNTLKSILERYVYSRFEILYPDYKLQIYKMSIKEVIDKFIQHGVLIGLSLCKPLSRDEFDNLYDSPDHTSGMKVISYKTSLKDNFKHGVIKLLLNNEKNNNKVLLENDYDESSIEVELNGRKKTIQISDLYNRSNRIDISENVSIDIDKHPKLESIHKLACEHITDLLSESQNK